MQVLTAPRIHDGRRFLPPGTAVALDAQGTVLEILPEAPGSARRLDGILCPGFVNAHGHIELAHLKGAIPEKTGLPGFLRAVMEQRGQTGKAERIAAQRNAAAEMIRMGIVACGDIANTADTVESMAGTALHIRTFVECIGFAPDAAAGRFQAACYLMQQFPEVERPVLRSRGLTAHATYSVSPELMRLLAGSAPMLSIHVLEGHDEQDFFTRRRGAFTALYERLGIKTDFFQTHGGSLQEQLAPVPDRMHLILVHNTQATDQDLAWAAGRAGETWFCLCPGANRYIEHTLPDLRRFRAYSDRMCLGTDSLASNHRLSIAHEAAMLLEAFPDLGWEELLRWACFQGACAMQMEHRVGTLQPGMQPGLVQLEGTDPGEMLRVTRIC